MQLQQPIVQYMHNTAYLDLGSECIWVAFKDRFHCRLSCVLILPIIEAISAVAAITIAPTRKTLAVPAVKCAGFVVVWVCSVGAAA